MSAFGLQRLISRGTKALASRFRRAPRAHNRPRGTTGVFDFDGAEVSVEVVDRFQGERRVSQAVRRRLWPSGRILDELVIPLSDTDCGIVQIAPSKSGRWLATSRHSGVSHCGYDILSTRPLSRVAGTEEVNMVMTLPQFAEDESLVVGALLHDEGSWWNNPDIAPTEPARGGLVRLGYLLVHRLPGHSVSRHALYGRVPAGWIPADPIATLADGIPLTITPTGNAIHLSLAHGAPIVVRTPFPASIDLPFSPALDGTAR